LQSYSTNFDQCFQNPNFKSPSKIILLHLLLPSSFRFSLSPLKSLTLSFSASFYMSQIKKSISTSIHTFLYFYLICFSIFISDFLHFFSHFYVSWRYF
jgi:hypothetical protein